MLCLIVLCAEWERQDDQAAELRSSKADTRQLLLSESLPMTGAIASRYPFHAKARYAIAAP